jgi:glutathione S-transferase
MEFGSAILGDIWGLETTPDAAVFEAKRMALKTKFARVEEALGPGPFFAGERICLVDAVFGPVFRYFDTFDELIELGIFEAMPKVGAWRSALSVRPSVRDAAPSNYPELLRAFLVRHSAYMLHGQFSS